MDCDIVNLDNLEIKDNICRSIRDVWSFGGGKPLDIIFIFTILAYLIYYK